MKLLYTLDKIANAPINISLIILDMNATKNDKYNILIVYFIIPCYTSTDFSLYKSDSIKLANFPWICLSTHKHD
jgi:hypothetical protein